MCRRAWCSPTLGAVLPRRNDGRFFGWNVVAAGASVEFMLGILFQHALGGYAAAITRQFDWSRGAVGLGFSLAGSGNNILGPLQAWLLQRFGPASVIRAGLVVLAAGFVLFSRIDSFGGFFVALGVMTIGGGVAGSLPVSVAVVNWFVRRRTRALGLVQAGHVLGGLLAPFIILAIIGLGWRQVALASAILVLAIGIPVTIFVRRSPAEMGLHADGLAEPEHRPHHETDQTSTLPARTDPVDFTTGEALRSPAFWLISLGHGSAMFVVSAVSVHMFLYLTGSLGYADGQAVILIGLMTTARICGLAFAAAVGDRTSKRAIAVVAMVMHSAALLLVVHVGTVVGAVGWALLHGAAWGSRGSLMGALRADYFGRSSFGMIMGISSIIVAVGALGGPVIAGVLYDRTGSYAPGFTVIATIAAAGSLFFAFAARPAHPVRASMPASHSRFW